MRVSKITLFTALIFSILSCTNAGADKKYRPIIDITQFVTKYPELKKENNIQKLIALIEVSEYVYGKSYGFTGEESYVYDCYETLCELASDSMWLRLTYSTSAVMRVYAYEALINSNKTLAIKAGRRLENDTARVCLYSADVKMGCSIENLVKHVYK